MENARKLSDCYFYYYSTCTKGEACNFRHEPEALGCESMCFYWQQGKCFDQHCKLRHMELRKNRKQIPCYWETQPGGCRKKHCSFLHKNPQARTDGISPSQPGMPLMGGRDPQQQAVSREAVEGTLSLNSAGLHQAPVTQTTPSPSPSASHNTHPPNWQRQVAMDPGMIRGATLEGQQHPGLPSLPPHNPMTPMAPINSMTPLAAAYSALQPVDSLVVNFEEESDSESVTGLSPSKNSLDDGKHRVDLIRLEQIQEETAAFYSYSDTLSNSLDVEMRNEMKVAKRKLPLEYECMTLDEINGLKGGIKRTKESDFRVLTLSEIKEKKRQNKGFDLESSNDSVTAFCCYKLGSETNTAPSPVEVEKEFMHSFSQVGPPARSKLKRNRSSVQNNFEEMFQSNSLTKEYCDEKCDDSEVLSGGDSVSRTFAVEFNKDSMTRMMEDSNISKDDNIQMVLSNCVPDLVASCTQKQVHL